MVARRRVSAVVERLVDVIAELEGSDSCVVLSWLHVPHRWAQIFGDIGICLSIVLVIIGARQLSTEVSATR